MSERMAEDHSEENNEMPPDPTDDELVDEQGLESFPASDPPAH
jgi:hypothetical protein